MEHLETFAKQFEFNKMYDSHGELLCYMRVLNEYCRVSIEELPLGIQINCTLWVDNGNVDKEKFDRSFFIGYYHEEIMHGKYETFRMAMKAHIEALIVDTFKKTLWDE